MGLNARTQDQAINDTKTIEDFLRDRPTPAQTRNVGEALENSSQAVLDSFVRLYKASMFAIECNRSQWEFAIEIKQLQRTGITSEEIRWLIGKNLVDQAEEITSLGESSRSFQSPGGFMLSERSCLVLTDLGIKVAEQTIDSILSKPNQPVVDETPQALKPRWDTVRHELRLGNVIVKKFKWRAANQEAILNAFEEDGWPAHIDDPLTQNPQMNPKRRLSDAIKCLNRKQKNPLIRFCGDGTGEGVLWELVEQDEQP